MDMINFYEPPSRAGLRGEKRPPASSGSVPLIGNRCEGRQAFRPGIRPNERLRDYDLIEVLDITTPPPHELSDPFDHVGKSEVQVIAAGADAGGRSFYPPRSTMVDDFADMTNNPYHSREHGRMGSEESQDLPSPKQLLYCAKEMQEPHQAGGNGIHLTARLDESLGEAGENNWEEWNNYESGLGTSKGGYMSSVCY